MPKFEVTWSVDINASSPEHAAMTARDMMLDASEEVVLLDVRQYTYCEPADDYFPDLDHGWQARFEDTRDPVRPSRMIELITLKR